MSFNETSCHLYLLHTSLGARFMRFIATSLRSKPGVISVHICSSWSWSCITTTSFSLVGWFSLQCPHIIIRKIKPGAFIKFFSNLWTLVKFYKFWKYFPGCYSFYKVLFDVLGTEWAHHIHVPWNKVSTMWFSFPLLSQTWHCPLLEKWQWKCLKPLSGCIQQSKSTVQKTISLMPKQRNLLNLFLLLNYSSWS